MKNKIFTLTLVWTVLFSIIAQAEEVKTRVTELQNQETKLISEKAAEDKFDADFWLSFIHAAGNTDSLSISADNNILWRKNKFESRWKLGAYFYRVFNSNSRTTGTLSEYIYGTYRLDYYFHPRATIYIGGGGYSDRITGIDAAGKGFTGFTYLVVDTETTKVRVEAGYDYTYEDRVAPDVNVSVHSIATGVDVSHQINEYVSLFEALESQQNVMSISDFRLQNEIGVKSKLTKIISIKASHKLRFDNQPVTGFGKIDSITDIAFGLVF